MFLKKARGKGISNVAASCFRQMTSTIEPSVPGSARDSAVYVGSNNSKAARGLGTRLWLVPIHVLKNALIMLFGDLISFALQVMRVTKRGDPWAVILYM